MAEFKSRIYLVKTPNGERLVRAKTKIGAVAFVARGTLSAQLASQDDLERLLPGGAKVEEFAGEDE